MKYTHYKDFTEICHLTVDDLEENKISFDLSEETINKSIFGKEQELTHVNLERSATLETRIGGHLVEGHVDETGICREIEKLSDSTIITFEVNKNLLENIIIFFNMKKLNKNNIKNKKYGPDIDDCAVPACKSTSNAFKAIVGGGTKSSLNKSLPCFSTN